MTREFCKALSVEQLQRAHNAYSVIACIYEDVCGGPYKAREFKEYFAAMDSRENLRLRYNDIITGRDGNDDNETT